MNTMDAKRLDDALLLVSQRDGLLCDDSGIRAIGASDACLSVLISDGLIAEERSEIFNGRMEYCITNKGKAHLYKGGYLYMQNQARQKKVMEWVDRLLDFKVLVAAILGFLLHELLSILGLALQWLSQTLIQ